MSMVFVYKQNPLLVISKGFCYLPGFPSAGSPGFGFLGFGIGWICVSILFVSVGLVFVCCSIC